MENEAIKHIKRFECGCIMEEYETFFSQECEDNPMQCNIQGQNYCQHCGRNVYEEFKEDHDPNCIFC